MKRRTKETERIERLLRERFPGYPREYPPEAYRYNSASIRLRLVHEDFRDSSLDERERRVWPVLQELPEKTQNDIMVVLIYAPDEVAASLGNQEFEHPTPTRI